MTVDTLTKTETRYNRGAILTLLLIIFLILVSFSQFMYRFTLPTDVWSAYTTDLEEWNWIYDANLVGVPSDLQPGDVVLMVDGVPVGSKASIDYLSPLRRRKQSSIDRRFYRHKYGTEHALAAFAHAARGEVNEDKITVALLSVVEETMQPEKTNLWLKQ